MNNYEFCAQWIVSQEHGKNVRVLDYGCGAGQLVKELHNLGINSAFGCDVFYEGQSIDPSLLGDTIRRMVGNAIPFENASFDFIINNQVMEHVENLDIVLTEIQRVLIPGGIVLSIFPEKSCFREGHSGIPFLHWFSKGSRLRVYYAAILRILGFGYYTKNKSVMQWSEHICEWLDKWTNYRTQREIDSTYKKYFSDIQHIEDYWLKQRLGNRKIVATWLPVEIQKLVVSKFFDLVFVASSPRSLDKTIQNV